MIRILKEELPLIRRIIVAAVVLSILIAVVYGYLYGRQLTRRSDGCNALMDLQIRQQEFRANCPWFARSIGAQNLCSRDTEVFTVMANEMSPQGHYRVAIDESTVTNSGYRAEALIVEATSVDQACRTIQLKVSAENPEGVFHPRFCCP